MTGSVEEELELDERELGEPVDEGGDTPEGPSEPPVATPAGPPRPFEPDGPISRDDVLVRSASWVKERVPYSQTSKHTNGFGSYRADCSGFVSMSWHLSSSLTTLTLPGVMNEIARANLQPGDALWRRSAGEGHVALFLRWANSTRTRPVVREEFDFGEVAEERTWTRDYASIFTPMRYKRITEDGHAIAPQAPGELTDGMLVQRAGSPVAVLVGSARVALANRAERTAIGADDQPVRTVTPQRWSALPSVPDDGTLVSGAPGLPAALIVGGARLNIRNSDEIVESGHGGKPVQPIPARAFKAMATRIEDGTLVSAAGLPVAVIVGGARINLRDADEVTATGHAGKPVRRIPARVHSGLSSRIADGTLVGAAGLPAAVIVGGARVNFGGSDEIVATGHAGKPVHRIPARVFTGLPTQIEDGTLLRTPESPTVWRMAGGKRSKVAGGAAQVIPMRVLDGIPVQG